MFDISNEEAARVTEKFKNTFTDCWDNNSEPASNDYVFSES